LVEQEIKEAMLNAKHAFEQSFVGCADGTVLRVYFRNEIADISISDGSMGFYSIQADSITQGRELDA
jgi:hypothetical protein